MGDDVFAKVDVRSRIRQIESKRPKPTLAPKDANPIPMPKPAMKYRPKEVSKYSVSRRLVEDDVFAKVDVRSRIQQIESKRPKPTLAPKDANPIPMPKPAVKYRPKEVSKYSVSRRLV